MELTPVAKRGGLGAGLLAAAGVFMLVFLIILSLTGVWVLDVFLSLWVSALIVSAILLLVGGILAGAGAGILRRLDPKPHRTIATLQQNINWIKGQFR
jgi:apolipoprotein N-acyltransferase